jgi:UDP-GlcNAc:undecaprenyl-phosphate GlcNAc-1-phosphate transferase
MPDVPTGEMISARNVLLPMIAFLMPIVDTTCVVINRLLHRQSPFIGGKDHTTHALAYRGLSDNKVALVFGAIALLSFLVIILIEKYIIYWEHTYTVVFSLYFLAFFTYFFRATRRAEAHIK